MISDDSIAKTVAEDLKYLRFEWNQDVDEVSVRVLSPILRRLLVQGDLQKAWKILGFAKSPRIDTYTLAKNILANKSKAIEFASAGGALQDGIRSVGFTAIDTEHPKYSKELSNTTPPQIESLWLDAFLKSACLVVQGHSVPRRALIQYVANKLGGDHFDTKRDESASGQLFQLLDYAHSKYGIVLGIHRKSVIYYELLSIGQALAHSEDINRLCQEVSKTHWN